MGDEDPTNILNAETSRILFKNATLSTANWRNSFRSWPSKVVGWCNWYQRMLSSKYQFWNDLGSAQCINLSLAEMDKDEPLISSDLTEEVLATSMQAKMMELTSHQRLDLTDATHARNKELTKSK
uniref:Uncharacterized protein n=1 Tax=Oryza glumipatula TaxID=40148 RepID=A0A0E0BUX7_9ORYZ